MSDIEQAKARLENWKPVVGYEGFYEVSDLGRVRSVARQVRHPRGGLKLVRERLLSLGKHPCGYLRFRAWRGDAVTNLSVHVEVLKAFVGPAPAGFECCHNDGNPANNVLENLRWDSRKNNHADKIAHGTYSKFPPSKYVEIRALRANGLLHREISKIVGVSLSHVGHILTGRCHAANLTEQP